MNKNYLLREREKAPLDANVLPLEEKGGGAGGWRRSKKVQRGGRGETSSTLETALLHPSWLDCARAILLLTVYVVTLSESCDLMISSVGALALGPAAGSSYQQLQFQK